MKLDNLITKKVIKPPRVFLYGIEGIGKTTFAASAPAPVILQTEDGADLLDVPRFPVAERFDVVLEELDALIAEPHEFQTLAIDSVDWLEKLIFDRVCEDYRVKNIQQAAGGYGRGYDAAMKFWQQIRAKLATLRDRRGMAIVLLAHHQIKAVGDPEYPDYQQYQPRLQDKAMHMLSEWVDAVLFATRKMRVDEDGKAHPTGADGGERILRCVGSPTCIAKSRYALPAEIPLNWNAFMEEFNACVRDNRINPDVPQNENN